PSFFSDPVQRPRSAMPVEYGLHFFMCRRPLTVGRVNTSISPSVLVSVVRRRIGRNQLGKWLTLQSLPLIWSDRSISNRWVNHHSMDLATGVCDRYGWRDVIAPLHVSLRVIWCSYAQKVSDIWRRSVVPNFPNINAHGV